MRNQRVTRVFPTEIWDPAKAKTPALAATKTGAQLRIVEQEFYTMDAGGCHGL